SWMKAEPEFGCAGDSYRTRYRPDGSAIRSSASRSPCAVCWTAAAVRLFPSGLISASATQKTHLPGWLQSTWLCACSEPPLLVVSSAATAMDSCGPDSLVG